MKYGFVIPNGTPREVGELAAEAEAAGWDGAFYWDGLSVDGDYVCYDPWVTLGIMALKTDRIRLGLMVTPPSRRRPWKLAREIITVDQISGGRLVVPVALGALTDRGFANVGEATDRRERAELLDESLEIIAGMQRGGSFSYSGKHYTIDDLQHLPAGVQQPHVPIWVVAAAGRAKSMARALKYDGVLPNFANEQGEYRSETPEDLVELSAYIREHRTESGPFEIIVEGITPGDDPAAAAAITAPRAAAGATWWIESPWSPPNQVEDLRRRIRLGPPRIDAA